MGTKRVCGNESLQGISGVVCYIYIYLDDIHITGESNSARLRNLEEVLMHRKEHGIQLKTEKCHFFRKSVKYLGHTVNADGVRTSSHKVQAIVKEPIPRNVKKLCSFWGLINYFKVTIIYGYKF